MTAFRDPIAWEDSLKLRPSSPAWRASVRALYGSPLEEAELELFWQVARRDPPAGGADEFLAVVGRRGGKSETIARIATYEALHGGHAVALAPGQYGLIPIISPLREQSGEIVRYCHGLAALPQVRRHVEGEPTREGLRFKTGVEIRTMTADAVNVSGPTVVCAIREEFAKFPGADAANGGDREIDNSLRPALAPLAGAPRRRLIGITSSYIRDGVAYETDRDHFGRPDADVLVVRGSTSTFNPNINEAWLARERSRVGERVFGREYLAEWQDAITNGWFGDVVDQCVDKGRESSPPNRSWNSRTEYVAAIDAAFRGDRFALAIAHREHREGKPALTVLDYVRAWQAPRGESIDVAEVVGESAKIIRDYRALAFADQFAIDPLKELYRRHQVQLWEAPWTALTKPQRFGWVRAQMASSPPLVRLCDNRALISEFHSVQGKLLKSGGERLEARIGHDDLVHAAVTALYFAGERSPDYGEGDGSPVVLRVPSTRATRW